MAEGDELGGPLGRHHASNPSDAKHVDLGQLMPPDCVERRCLHPNRPGRLRNPVRLFLRRDVDHSRLTGGINMGELAHESMGEISRRRAAVTSSGFALFSANSLARSTASIAIVAPRACRGL